MDITITWANGGGYQPTDGWNVLYREHTPTNVNNWILATDPDLLPNVNQYTITGLTPNVIYDVAVVKSCASVFDQMSQRIFAYMACPIVSTWQGPVVNGKPTLFYSVYYEEGSDIGSVSVRLYESTPQVFNVIDAIGNGTNILFTTGSVHDLLATSEVVVTGVSPAGYNGTYTIISKTASAFVVAGTYTGPFVSDGIVTYTPGMIGDAPEPRINSVIGKLAYQVINASQTNPITYLAAINCGTDGLAFAFPNSTNSAAGYFGTEHANINVGALCGPSISQNFLATTFSPILLDYNTTINPREYKLGTVGYYDTAANYGPNPPAIILGEVCPGDSITTVTTSFTFDDDSLQPYRNLNVANSANISAAICFDSVAGIVDYTLGDGLGRTNINDYVFSFTTSDGAAPLFPLLDNAGNPITSYNGSYNIYAPIKIQTFAPGGGNPLGYTITNAIVAGGSTTYTYSGGTNAFTVGQEVFVNNVNPIAFNFSNLSKTITAATPNSFTVSYNPAGTYQTGGNASGYTELTNGMTITVDLQPAQNVITLTNQNYTGLTLKQALDNIVNSINTTTSYSASAVVISGIPYLKINVPGTTYTSASVIFEGPNILTKGAPDILQTSSAAAALSSINYNGFLYASFSETASSKIVASDINNPTIATNYSHPIDIPISEIVLVPEVPPSTVYFLDRVVSGGDYSLNIAVDPATGYSYSADHLTVSVYDGTTFIDSQDLSALVGGPVTPIRLMEFNSIDNTLYVFVDSSMVDNFYIVDVAPWAIVTSGTYGQTNYSKRGTITAWNNLTTGPTAAMGTITSAPPEQPILCATMPCACIAGGPVAPPFCGVAPNWQIGRNDGVRSELFQDSTKNWPTNSIYNSGYFQVYNYDTQQLGFKTYFQAGDPYYNLQGIAGDTIAISGAIDITLPYTYSTFASSFGDDYGLFSIYLIVDYNETFTSRSWENTARYLIEGGRNVGANGFITTPVIHPTYIVPDSYIRGLPNGDKGIYQTALALDGTSEYLLYEIKDGGTCYHSTSNFVYISLDGGLYEAIDNLGNVLSYQLYKDFTNPSPSTPVQVPLQMVVDPNSDLVYGIARDARSDVDDMNIYVFNDHGQVNVIDGSILWNVPICGQISIDSTTGILYFTGKHTRNFYEYDPATGFWDNKIIPSLYEKVDGYTYGTASPLSRLQGIVERIQGASYIGGGKFVVMNYMQQVFSTELKYVYDVANLFVYDYTNNTIEQALIGTGVNTYSGAAASYNLNYYGESFGINDYNNDYCYGGLSIRTNPNTGRIFWKKSISDEVYFSEQNIETGVAQIWGNGAGSTTGSRTIRIWNIQNDGLGTLIPSKRTILDSYSSFFNMLYDSYYKGLVTAVSGIGLQFYVINTKTLGGLHGVNTISQVGKNGQQSFIAGLTPSLFNNGKQSFVYGAVASPTEIVYSVRPLGAAINGVFPHHYAVGDIVNINGVISTPVNQLNFTNATITAVTPTTFTIANTTSTTAVFNTSGSVVLSNYANMSASNLKFTTDNAGNIYCWGGAAGPNYPTNSNVILKFNYSDLYTQRETPDIINIGTVSVPCSATPDGIFVEGSFYTMMNNSFIHIPSQNTFWLLGRKNPTCSTSNITNAVYNAGTQTIRYTINNNFLVGKVVNISYVLPSQYNLFNVTLTAVDPAWVEISYTGIAPPAFDPLTPAGSKIELSPSYIIKVLNDTTFATVATIDLAFINDFVGSLANTNGRFQYSEAEEKMYLYSAGPDRAIYAFSTVTNNLVQSNSLNRMVLPYTKLTTIYTMQDVNGIPYFNAYTATDTPTKRWFRLTAGTRVYLDNVHNVLNISTTDVVGTTTNSYDIYNLTNMSDTFGQWKEITDTTWATVLSSITITLGTRIEFTSFIIDKPLVEIRNLTQGTTFAITSISGVPLIGLLADNVTLNNGDVLEFEFTNPANPSCPFINQTTITII